MLDEFELNHSAVEATKSLYCAKCEGAVNHNNQIFQEISIRLQEPRQSGKVR